MSVDAVLDSKQKALEAQIDDEVKDPDQRRSAKAQVNGYFSALRATCYTMAADKRYSEDDIRRRALESSKMIELKVRPFFEKSAEYKTATAAKKDTLADLRARITSAKPAASTAALKPATVVAIAAKADRAADAALRAETGTAAAPATKVAAPHVKVLPGIEISVDLPGSGTPITDGIAALPIQAAMVGARVVAPVFHAMHRVAGDILRPAVESMREGYAGLKEEHPLFELPGIVATDAARAAKAFVSSHTPASVKQDLRAGSEAIDEMPARLEAEYGIAPSDTRRWIDDTAAIASGVVMLGAGKAVGAAIEGAALRRAAIAEGEIHVQPLLRFQWERPITKMHAAERVPPDALPAPRLALPAPPKTTAESIMPATAAAPEASSARDLVLANIRASRVAHATPAYRAFDREAAVAALGKAGSPVVTSTSPTGVLFAEAKPLIERVSLIPSARPLISGGAPAGETVVVVQSIHDKTGAFRVPITARVQQLARGRNLVYKQVDSAQGVADAMGQMGNVSHALIRAHGNPRAIFFDPYGTTAEALAHALRKGSFTASRKAEVYLEACSTAAKPLDGSLSFAHKLDDLLGERVSIIAARSGVVPSFTQMKPGSVQFYGQLERPEILSAGTKVLRGPEETFRIGRISNSEVYTKLLRGEGITTYSRHLKFSEPPKVFSGVTPRDLVFVQYHIGSLPLHTWFVSAEDAKALTTMDAIRKHTVLSDSPASFTHMTVTRIPAGETINTLRGKVIAEGKWSSAIHWGEMTQHYFYDFDPKWKSVTLPWPCSSEGLDSFDAIVKAASESRARPTLSLRPKTVYEETKAPSIRQPLSKPTAEEAPSASIVVTESIPPLSDVISKTYHTRTETILYRGVLADLEISCIKHTDGTWRVFIQSLAVQGTEIGDQTFTSGLILKALSVTRDIAEKELGASRVVIQWMPVNDKFLSPSFQAHLTRYRHYVGLQNAHNFPPLVMLLKKMGLKVLGKKDGEFPTLVYDLTKQSSEEGLSPASAAETGIPAYAEELIATPQNSFRAADLPSAASLSKVLRMQADNPLKLFSSDAITGLKLYRQYTQAVMKRGETFDSGAAPKFPVEGPLERVRAVLPPKGKFSDILTSSGAKPFDLGKGPNVNGYYLTDGESTFAVVEKRMSERQALEQLKAVARFQEQNLIDLQVPELLAFELSQNRAGIFSAYETSPSMLDWVQELPSDPIMAREALYRLGSADAELHSAQYGRYFVSLPMRKKYIAELVANYHLVREATMKLGIKVPHNPEEIRELTKEFEENDQMIASFGLDPEDAHLSNRSYNPTEDTVMIFNLARSSALISAGGTPLGHPMHNYKGTLAALQREASALRIDEAKLIMPYKSGYKENFVGDTEAEGQFWNVYMKYEEWKTILENHSQDLPVGFGLHHEDYEALWTKV